MADYAIVIGISDLEYTAWLRTSYASLGLLDKEGNPALDVEELGPDQADAFSNFKDEASREVLKLFVPRQGDLTAAPFSDDGTDITFRIYEREPVLGNSAGIKAALDSDVKTALFTYVTLLWYVNKGHVENAKILMEKYNKISNDIEYNLYRIHD